MTFHNRDGSKTTQRQRLANLMMFARQLDSMGYKRMQARSLKRKHVDALLKLWRQEKSTRTKAEISPATLKNRMSFLRWWAEKIAKPGVVPKTNAEVARAESAYPR